MRLAGFEAEEHKHVLLLLVCTVALDEPDIVHRPAIWEELRLLSMGPSLSPLRLFVAGEMVREADGDWGEEKNFLSLICPRTGRLAETRGPVNDGRIIPLALPDGLPAQRGWRGGKSPVYRISIARHEMRAMHLRMYVLPRKLRGASIVAASALLQAFTIALRGRR